MERSKVRVKFFQSGKPQQISPPDNNLGFYDFEQSLLSDYLSNDINNISDNTMTATAVPPTYDRQIRWAKSMFFCCWYFHSQILLSAIEQMLCLAVVSYGYNFMIKWLNVYLNDLYTNKHVNFFHQNVVIKIAAEFNTFDFHAIL